MRRLLPDSVFGRLFGLVALALVVSHLIAAALLVFIAPPAFRGPPPRFEGGDMVRPPEARQDTPPGPHGGEGAERRHFDPDEPPRPLPGAPLGLWVGLTIQFIAVTLAAGVGARMIARPIQQLANAAARLGDNLNSPPVAEQGPEEARQAARVFNHMQNRIRAQLEERERFLAAVSHDLRTPLTRMKLRIEAPVDEENRSRLREDIAEMAAMLDATLGYLRGEAHSEPWQLLDVQALADSVAEDAREHGAEVEVRGTARPIQGQPTALRRCLDNLVDNAVRYGQRATIVLDDQPTQLVVEVRDQGPGIPENRIAQVMEPFVRLEGSRNRNSGGVGLGLSIARDAARRNGGELVLRNAAEGGLIARLVLPRQS
ncbi:HAMP domain-containing protein [Azoarcus sp. TTM-91]|uniref:ATP-binding protein n=1 Tax=Azoarcus sp. TTM-91 TaxID=2691581 RepID=UPI00145FA7C6|nr:ATP-binding protein [Azoarcus sp. TTM-91]NMG36091.1 HAMP domain-containing protein [Azoarcus sp. TTM-91]